MEGQEPETGLEEEPGSAWSGPGNHTRGRGLAALLLGAARGPASGKSRSRRPDLGGTGLAFRPRRLVTTLWARACAHSKVQAAGGAGDIAWAGTKPRRCPELNPSPTRSEGFWEAVCRAWGRGAGGEVTERHCGNWEPLKPWRGLGWGLRPVQGGPWLRWGRWL